MIPQGEQLGTTDDDELTCGGCGGPWPCEMGCHDPNELRDTKQRLAEAERLLELLVGDRRLIYHEHAISHLPVVPFDECTRSLCRRSREIRTFLTPGEG